MEKDLKQLARAIEKLGDVVLELINTSEHDRTGWEQNHLTDRTNEAISEAKAIRLLA